MIPVLGGLSKRSRALILLTVQNASIALLTRASRVGSPDDLYLPSVAVLGAEVLKALFSLATLTREHRRQTASAASKKDDDAVGSAAARQSNRPWRISDLAAPLHEALATRRADFLILLVPSILYSGQNNLLYVAITNLPVAVYQITYQLKILTTSLFSVLFFNRRYSAAKWISLLLLTCGVAIVQLPDNSSSAGQPKVSATPAAGNATVGVLAIFAACISSGIAGCYFEAILKPSASALASKAGPKGPVLPPPSLALRNLQLALISIPFALIGVFGPEYDRHRVLSHGLFDGFNRLGYFVVLNQAFGGLLIASVVKEADSVSKGFATSIAILLSTAVSSLLTRSLPNLQFAVGAAFVVSATTMFAVVP